MDTLPPLVLIGPSGVGKSTLARALESTGTFEIIRSYTTRPRRDGEDDSTHIFVSDEAFDKTDASGVFIGHTEVFGHRYALPHLNPSSKRPVVIIRAPLVPMCRQLFPDCVVVALTAPIDVLGSRIGDRGDSERIEQEQFDAELSLGTKLASIVIDTTQPIETCTEQIAAALASN